MKQELKALLDTLKSDVDGLVYYLNQPQFDDEQKSRYIVSSAPRLAELNHHIELIRKLITREARENDTGNQ